MATTMSITRVHIDLSAKDLSGQSQTDRDNGCFALNLHRDVVSSNLHQARLLNLCIGGIGALPGQMIYLLFDGVSPSYVNKQHLPVIANWLGTEDDIKRCVVHDGGLWNFVQPKIREFKFALRNKTGPVKIKQNFQLSCCLEFYH